MAKGRSVPLGALVEARQALEPMVAYLAARNRSDEDLALTPPSHDPAVQPPAAAFIIF